LEETFEEQLNTKLESLKFDNVEDGLNNLRKIVFEVAVGVLGKKVRNAAKTISENALCLIERRRYFYKNYLSGRSCENKRTVMKIEKELKYELRLGIETMDKSGVKQSYILSPFM